MCTLLLYCHPDILFRWKKQVTRGLCGWWPEWNQNFITICAEA